MLKLVGILCFASVAFAALARYPPQEKPPQFADQEGCYIKDQYIDRVLPYDQPYYDGNCQVYTCQSSNNETVAESCGALAIRPGCRKSENDLTKNYPDCCGIEVCDGTTVAPTTEASTTQVPVNPGYAYASASAQAGGVNPPTSTATSTTEAATTPAPTTQAPTTQPPANTGSYASAIAQSGGGKPPVTETYTSGPGAQATATAS